MLKVVDLFAGAGGLSLGFVQTGIFEIKVAIEKNICAQKTYLKNHPKVEMLDDVCKVDFGKVIEKYGNIDVVIGGPPCQGFSNANRQKRHVISQNNMLVKQYVKAISELQPRAFVMENVSMLKSDVHRFYLENGEEEVTSGLGIPIKDDEIILLPTEFKFRGVKDIVCDRVQVKNYMSLPEDYKILDLVFRAQKSYEKLKNSLEKYKNKFEGIAQRIELIKGNNLAINEINQELAQELMNISNDGIIATRLSCVEKWLMVQRMLSKSQELFENNIAFEYSDEYDLVAKVKSYAVFDFIEKNLGGKTNDYVIANDVLCAADYGVPQKRKRFVIMGVKRDIVADISLPKGDYSPDKYNTVRDAIYDIPGKSTFFDVEQDKGIVLSCEKRGLSNLAKQLRDSAILYNHIITRSRDVALKRFAVLKQGQNFHDLDCSLKENTYTDIARTQNTIYSRLQYDEPSGTVVNVRKSMWIHPEEDRALSIREAARLQSFPDSFIFVGTKDSQYQQVGNAVPPMMAKAIALNLAKTLNVCEKIRKMF